MRNIGSNGETSSFYEVEKVAGMSMQTYLALSKRQSDLTDGDLVQQAQVGDQGAFEILFERYSSSLFFLISRIVRDEHLAHDVLQHVFIQLHRSLPTLVLGGRSLRPWLSQIARYRSIDELRRKRPIFFSEIEPFPDGGEYSFLSTIPDPDRLPEEQAELHELRQRLLTAIEALPLNYRTIVQLRYSTQMTFREIGLALSIPETVAKTYFYRAKGPLRASLANYRARERE